MSSRKKTLKMSSRKKALKMSLQVLLKMSSRKKIFENVSNKIFFIMLLSCHYYAIIIPSLCFLKFVFLYKNQRCHYDAIMALLKWHYNVLSTENAIITF